MSGDTHSNTINKITQRIEAGDFSKPYKDIFDNFKEEVVSITNQRVFNNVLILQIRCAKASRDKLLGIITSSELERIKSEALNDLYDNASQFVPKKVTDVKTAIQNVLIKFSTVDNEMAASILKKLNNLSSSELAPNAKTFVNTLMQEMKDVLANYKNGIFYLFAVAAVATLSSLRPLKDQNQA